MPHASLISTGLKRKYRYGSTFKKLTWIGKTA